MSPSFRGVITPVITVLDGSGDLDQHAQARVIERQLDAGVHGIFVAGTTGEGAFLSSGQLRRLVEVAVAQVAGRVPVLAGALAPGTDQVIALGRQAAEAGVDGLVVTTPFYVASSPVELELHFRSVAAAVELPVLAYSIPPMTHQQLSLGVVEALFAGDVVAGLKDSGHDLDTTLGAVALGSAYGKVVLPGYERHALAALEAGADGVVASMANVDPMRFVALWGAVRSKDLAGARALQAQIDRLVAGFGTPSGDLGPTSTLIARIKACCQLLGIAPGRAVLGPLLELPESGLDACSAHLEALGLG